MAVSIDAGKTGIPRLVSDVSYSGNITDPITGTDGQSFTRGSANYNTSTGTAGIAWHYGSGTVASAYGGRFQARNAGTGTITDAIGVKLNPNTNEGGGTVAYNYGLFVNNSAIGSTQNSAVHIYNAGTQGMLSWGNNGNSASAYIYLKSAGNLEISGSLGVTGRVAATKTTGTAVVRSVGAQELFTIQNSKTITLQAGFGCFFIVSFGGSGKSGLFWATYDSATITSLGTLPAGMELTATPTATALGISKSSNSRNILLTAGSGLAAAQTNMSVSIMGSDVLAWSDWT